MIDKRELRELLHERLDEIIVEVNEALEGRSIDRLAQVLKRVGSGGRIPHWYEQLRQDGTLPNLDGKTIGSVVEMILLAILEVSTFKDIEGIPPLRINPARGVDFPDLDLGLKSPSENYCTSEPFFSAYERLIGSDHDAVVLLTNYQQSKREPPLRLQIIKHRYLTKTQIADSGLCAIARKHRDWLLEENEAWAKKILRFLVHINQSDWKAKSILALVTSLDDPDRLKIQIKEDIPSSFHELNQRRASKDREPLPDSELEELLGILKIAPLRLGVIDAADNWVLAAHKDFARFPNDNEWMRFVESPLDGKIGMSFALQWRYNFSHIFNSTE